MVANRLPSKIGLCLAMWATLALSGNRAPGAPPAGSQANNAKTQSLWLVSTREAPQCGGLEQAAADIHCWQWKTDGGWIPREAKAVSAAAGPSVPVVVFVHGSWNSADEAVEYGWGVYQMLRPDAGDRPFRCVIWSWPSDRQSRRIRPDMQRQQADTDAESYYLAKWLAALPAKTPVCLIGHSFGARIVTGSLQLLAGGQVAGRSLAAGRSPANPPTPRPLRAMLLAAAIDSNWLLLGHRNGLALTAAQRVFITRNPCDRVLRWYPRLYGRGGPEAIGLVGPLLSERAKSVEVVDVSGSMGSMHDVHGYLASAEFRSRLAHYAFLDPTPRKAQSLKPKAARRRFYDHRAANDRETDYLPRATQPMSWPPTDAITWAASPTARREVWPSRTTRHTPSQAAPRAATCWCANDGASSRTSGY